MPGWGSKEDTLRSVGQMLQNNLFVAPRFWKMLSNKFIKDDPVDIDDDWVHPDLKEKLDELKVRYNDIRENEIRELAYSLWEDAGRPDGCADEFWIQAEESLNGN